MLGNEDQTHVWIKCKDLLAAKRHGESRIYRFAEKNLSFTNVCVAGKFVPHVVQVQGAGFILQDGSSSINVKLDAGCVCSHSLSGMKAGVVQVMGTFFHTSTESHIVATSIIKLEGTNLSVRHIEFNEKQAYYSSIHTNNNIRSQFATALLEGVLEEPIKFSQSLSLSHANHREEEENYDYLMEGIMDFDDDDIETEPRHVTSINS